LWQDQSVRSGWPGPTATAFDYYNESYYVWYDTIGAWSSVPSTWDPVPVFTSGGPQFTYNLLLQRAPQAWWYGSKTPSCGLSIFSGNFYFFQDHGNSYE